MNLYKELVALNGGCPPDMGRLYDRFFTLDNMSNPSHRMSDALLSEAELLIGKVVEDAAAEDAAASGAQMAYQVAEQAFDSESDADQADQRADEEEEQQFQVVCALGLQHGQL